MRQTNAKFKDIGSFKIPGASLSIDLAINETEWSEDPSKAIETALRDMADRIRLLMQTGYAFKISKENKPQLQVTLHRVANLNRPFFNQSIAILELKSRTINALSRQGVKSISQLVTSSSARIMRMRGIGKAGVEDISQALCRYDCYLGMTD